MKKFIKTIYQVVVSMAMAFVGAVMCIQFNVGYYWAPLVAFMCCALIGALVTGVFDDAPEQSSYDSIRHYNGRKNYGQAAVFLGSACVFMGTLSDCEDVADDLWHNAQQARVEMLDGEETTFEVL